MSSIFGKTIPEKSIFINSHLRFHVFIKIIIKENINFFLEGEARNLNHIYKKTFIAHTTWEN